MSLKGVLSDSEFIDLVDEAKKGKKAAIKKLKESLPESYYNDLVAKGIINEEEKTFFQRLLSIFK
jgi:hypothetical protein